MIYWSIYLAFTAFAGGFYLLGLPWIHLQIAVNDSETSQSFLKSSWFETMLWDYSYVILN